MKFFRRMWYDVQQGENVDLYITLIGAVVIAALNFIYTVPPEWSTSITISILAFITFGILGNRYRIETIFKKISTENDVLLNDYPAELNDQIIKTKNLMILGVDLNRTLRKNYAQFMEKLEQGRHIKILLVDPDSPACTLAAERHLEPVTPDVKRADINRALMICEQLDQVTDGKLEVRLVDNMPPFGALHLDPESADSILYINYYRYKSPDGNGPKLLLRPSDTYWYNSFSKEIASLWNDAKKWNNISD